MREWQASGASPAEYAQGRGFAAATLVWWCSRLRRRRSRPGVAMPPEVHMARVVRRLSAGGSSLTVRVGAAGIEVSAGFDRELLREVVVALGGGK